MAHDGQSETSVDEVGRTSARARHEALVDGSLVVEAVDALVDRHHGRRLCQSD